MIGAIVGDISGSIYEFCNHLSKEFPLFGDDRFFTDDTVMTLAIGKAIKESLNANCRAKLSDLAVHLMQKLGRPYPSCGFGGSFYDWIYSDDPHPYNSFGNGAAMRVSAAGFAADSVEEAKALSRSVTEVTHSHPEGIKGAEAVAVAVYLAKTGATKRYLYMKMKEYYDLDFTLDEIRGVYYFNETCQGTVPQAIRAFLESVGFEDAIRNAISVGGDSDTLAAITGSIAEAYYGVPKKIEEKALSYLDDALRAVYFDCRNFNKIS